MTNKDQLWWQQSWERVHTSVRCQDVAALTRQLRRLRVKHDEHQRQAFESACARSEAWVQSRHACVPTWTYPDLPVVARREDILQALRTSQVVILAGETGSGKTTQLPKLCLEAGRGRRGLIGHTQPRRLAARNVALRIAEELSVPIPGPVGYKMRFTDQTMENTLIKVMTDGILLAELRADRWLSAYDTLIIDEAHERSLNIDFLLGALKLLRQRRPDLQLVITSATLQVEKFAAFFEGAPVLTVEGRQYPIETYYHPLPTGEDSDQETLGVAVLQAIETCMAEERQRGWAPGDVLVFASTEREIRDLHEFLRRALPPAVDLLPLYARLSAAEQQKVFAPHAGRRVVLSTNVAETSVTVPGIHYVIDPGKARTSRYAYRSKVQRLPIEPISQASANQRRGRAGRVAPGLCIRLYEEADFLQRPEFTDPEILRTHLASVILQMQDLELGQVEDFPWLDAPDSRLIADGYRLLDELGAMDGSRGLTEQGRALASWPLDPQLARVLLAAAALGCLREALMVVSALAVQDPRERPPEHAQLADQRHALFRDEQSDLLFYVRLWEHMAALWPESSERQRRSFARQHFLSWMRLREWRDMHRQLLLECEHRRWKFNEEPATYEALHAALLQGFPTQVAKRIEQREYSGCRGQKAFLYPGSALSRKPPEWLLGIEWVETQKVYMRQCARLDAVWIEKYLGHLLKRHHSDPHWERKQGRAMVMEQVSLLGLVILAGRSVPLAPIDAVQAHQIFLLDGLVRGQADIKAGVLQHNRDLVQAVLALEDKTRRRDLLVDEQVQVEFYAQRIPETIVDVRSFEHWLRQSPPDVLKMERSLLARADKPHAGEDFPDILHTPEGDFRLRYVFAPGDVRDGVTLLCPVGQYYSLPWGRIEHLVPGLRDEKVLQLLRSLPKSWRRQLVPLPEVAATLKLPEGLGMREGLVQALKIQRQIDITVDDFDLSSCAQHVLMNIQVVDLHGKVLLEGRHRDQLDVEMAALSPVAEPSSEEISDALPRKTWPEAGVPEQVRRGGGTALQVLYPALEDQGDAVVLRDLVRRSEAVLVHRRGTARLLVLAINDLLKPWYQKIYKQTLFIPLLKGGTAHELADDFLMAIVQHLAGLDEGEVRSLAEFQSRLLVARTGAAALAARMVEDLEKIAQALGEIRRKLTTLPMALQPLQEDVEQQLKELFPLHVLQQVGYRRWIHYPRYLKAILWRLERAGGQWERDLVSAQDVQKRYRACEALLAQRIQRQEDTHALWEYRWLLEEYRVALFAQAMKTVQPVSAVRLDRLWASLQ